ncbi:MAG: hypothetical protein R3182_08375, partial [Draconibacterium sp.]|nr:hypothetical protein [Draconibacterium sp.]
EEPCIKNEMWMYAASGYKAVENNNNKYTFINSSLNFSKQITKINKLGVGIDFIYDWSLTGLAEFKYGYMNDSDINFRMGPNIQGEFLFGKFSFVGAYGFYFGDPGYYVSRRYYKAGFKYNFGRFIAVGILRAVPLFKADAMEIGIGYSIKSY